VRRYGYWFDLWKEYPERVRALAARPEVRRVCDLGAGANPLLTLDEVAALGLHYELVDVSPTELAKAPVGYRKVCADATSPTFAADHGPYDLVVSTFVAEHVRDPVRFHRNVFNVLADGGWAVHVFPTLFEPAYLFNRLVPEPMSRRLLSGLARGDREDDGAHGKFPAYYRWCRGPTDRQIARFHGVGFQVEDYVGYFGHGYLGSVPPLNAALQHGFRALVRRPVPLLTSLAYVQLRRPWPGPPAGLNASPRSS
jgi:SAM-dependent methyltransferase